jgi:hypothetical protein
VVCCQKEDLTTTQNNEGVIKALYKQRTLTLEDIPKIKQKVIEKLNPEVFNRTEGSNTNQAIFDTENVLEIIDTLNNANYSFQFRFPDTPISTFYNLVVGETPTGEVLTPYVMKYESDDANLDNYIANGLDFKYFEGTMSIHKYTDYFALGEFDRTETQCSPELDEVGDPLPCDETSVSGSGSGSGIGNNNNNGTGNPIGNNGGGSNGSVTCTNQIYVIGCDGSNSATLHPIGECGSPNHPTVIEHNVWVCDGIAILGPNNGDTGRTINDVCPECDTTTPIGGVGINTDSNLIDKDALTTVTDCLGQDNEHIPFIVNNQLETTIANYINLNVCSPETEQFLEVAIIEFEEILDEFPDAIFERYIELLELIEEDPWVLIQDCAEQNQMDTSNYIDLYNHVIPQECQDRLDELGPEYNNQSISEGNVPLANIDYYGVEITNYPDFDNDGNPDTEAEIYQAFREKFTDLASGEKENFESECNVPFDFDNIINIWWQFNPMSNFDANLFLSNDPISSILLIDAGANNPFVNTNADLGAIIVSGFTSTNWTISTIQTPETETQPFSGNRQWGLLINQNGNLEFYTRAVDVARVADIFLEWPATWLGSDIDCQQDTYYDIAEATWQNMQQEIADWINDDEISHGGQATVNTPKAARVNKDKIIEILTTNESIEQILSNCN